MSFAHVAGCHYQSKVRRLASLRIENIFFENNKPTDNYRIFQNISNNTACRCVCTTVTLLFFLYFAYASGYFSAFVSGSKYTLFSFYIPGVEDDFETEYCINMILQFVTAVYFLMGNICIEFIFVSFNLAIDSNMALVEFDLCIFEKNLEIDSLTTIERKNKFIFVLECIQLSNDWLNEFNIFD